VCHLRCSHLARACSAAQPAQQRHLQGIPPGPPRRGRGRTRAQALAKYAFGLGFATMLVTGLVFMGMGLPPGHGLGTEILVRFFHAVRARPCPRRHPPRRRTRACEQCLAPAPS